MQTTTRVTAIVLAVIITFVCWASLKLAEPPDVVPSSEGDTRFSAERAVTFLKEIAKEPHAAGTPAHNVVRDYIFHYCKQMGLETDLMDATGLVAHLSAITAGRAQNILARIRGTRSDKTILVMSHYDSQPNTPGAGDDGVGVASMMESIRLLKNQPPLANDILFLFTDLEECGLLGAEAFVHRYKQLDSIALVINLEARGNSGVGFTFEFSELNGWMMREYSKAVDRPFANSFAYEIYKLMPNDTDFSKFRNTNVSGFNTALLNGYSYYHSMEDKVENLDLRSLQHMGDILTQSLQHFGKLSLANTKSEDVVFFTPVGSIMVVYPLIWDLPLMGLAFFLWFVLVTLGNKRRRIRFGWLFAGMGLFVCFFVLSALLVYGLSKLLLLVYPHYTNFYSDNFYNATDYFWAVCGVVLLCYVALFKYAASGDALVSVTLGSVFTLLLVMIGIKIYLNTGAYLIYYPVIIMLIVYFVLFKWNITRKEVPALYGLAQLLVITPALALWFPVAYTIYVAFSLEMPLAAVLLLVFCGPLLMPALGFMSSLGRFTVWIFPIALIVTGVVMGHLSSNYTNRYPLQTELGYALDTDSTASYWISTQQKLDSWLANYIQGTVKEDFDEFYPDRSDIFWKSKAPLQQIAKGKIEVLKDSLIEMRRHLTLRITTDSTCRAFRIYFFNYVMPVKLNERPIETSLASELRVMVFHAPPPGGTTIELEMLPNEHLDMRVIEQRPGLPNALLTTPLPENFIYGPDYLSNTTQVKYDVVL